MAAASSVSGVSGVSGIWQSWRNLRRTPIPSAGVRSRHRTARSAVPEDRWSAPGRAGGPQYARILALGSGGASNVSAAVARTAEGVCQLVVLKSVGEGHKGDGHAVLRLMDEARLTARMNHPNLVRGQGLHSENGLPVIVMEYLAGQSLATLTACANDLPQFSLELRIGIVVRILRGLDYAHRLRDFDGRPLRVVHGGVAPENVVITYNGEVKLVDFSRARVRVSSTETQPMRSRLPYVAPEQLGGAPDLRGDVFAAGVILWQLIAHRALWGQIPTPTVVRRLLQGDIPRLRDELPTVDAELDRICCRALAPQPDVRYRSAGDMRGDLEQYLATRNAFISDAAIGALVSDACREYRREVQETMSARLSELGLSLMHGDRGDPSKSVGLRSWLALPERRIAAYLVGASLIIAALMWPLFGRDPSRTGETQDPSDEPQTDRVVLSARTVPNAREINSRSSAIRLVRLELSAQPSHAVLYVDGQRLSANPLSAVMVWDPAVHTIRAEADGFAGFATTFRLDSNLRIDTVLRPELSGSVRRSADRPDELAHVRPRGRVDASLLQQ
jgi:serine/threonine protein kinase